MRVVGPIFHPNANSSAAAKGHDGPSCTLLHKAPIGKSTSKIRLLRHPRPYTIVSKVSTEESMLRDFVPLAAAAIFSSGQIAGQVRFNVTEVGNARPGEFSTAAAINDSGLIGGTTGGRPASTCFLQNNGTVTYYPSSQFLLTCDVKQINNSGQVIGSILFDSPVGTVPYGYVYEAGTLTQTPAQFFPTPSAINNVGDIVESYHGQSYLQSNGMVSLLPIPAGGPSGINDHGQVVGVSGGQAFLYSITDSAFTNLGTLGGASSFAAAINQSGQVAGYSELAGGAGPHAFLYEGGAMHDLGVLPGDNSSYATAINNAGQVVGYSMMAADPGRAFLYSNGAMRDLNDLIPSGSGWVLNRALGINGAGQIVGYGSLNGELQRGFLLTAAATGLTDLGGVFRARPVVAGNHDGRLEAFVVGTNHVLYHASQITPGGAWSAWESLGGYVTERPAVIADSAGRLVVFAGAHEDHTLWYRRQNAAGTRDWSDWASLGGFISSAPAAALNADGRIDVVAGSGAEIWEITETSTGSWGQWQKLGDDAGDAPVIAPDADGSLEVFVVSNDKTLQYLVQAVPNGNWQSWHTLGGGVSGVPAVTLDAAGTLEVYVRGVDKAVWRTVQTSGSRGWSPLGSLGGVISGSPSVALNVDGRVEVFAIGSDDGLWHTSQTSVGAGWSNWTLLGGLFKPPPFSVRNSDGTVAVVATGTNGSVYYKAQVTPGVWP
jgi:probable HAF family extracellular repeat protein